MKNLINNLKKYLHCHIYSKPVLSRYVSFHTREIVWRCRCGGMVAHRMTLPFGVAFPIKTTDDVGSDEIQDLLAGKIELGDICFTDEWLLKNKITANI